MASVHRQILPQVVEQIRSHHPDCSIILIGSVARCEERPDSDLDLNVFLNDSTQSPWIVPTNRWQLEVVCEIEGIRIDVAWETLDYLEAHVETDGPFWIMSCGETICDPSGRAEACLQKMRDWATANKTLCDQLESEFRKFKREQLARRRKEKGDS